MKRFPLSPISAAAMLTLAIVGQQAIAQETPKPAAEAGKLETVVIVGQRASRNAAVQSKRDADQVVESIVADDIGKFPTTPWPRRCSACRACRPSWVSTTRSSTR